MIIFFFCSYFKPRLVCMSDIVFHHPVEVGALLRMHARVCMKISYCLSQVASEQ